MKTMACSYDRTASYSYTSFFIAVFVLFPLATVSFCNVHIYLKVKRTKLRVGQHNQVNSVSRTVTSNTDGASHIDSDMTTADNNAEYNDDKGKGAPALKSKVRQGDVKLAKTLFIVFLVFLVCWAPYAGLCLFDFADQVPKVFYVIAIKMAHTNSSLNSILYAALNKNFLEGYKLFIKKVFFCFNRK